ncbi:MAG: LysR family transcriptional regulator [Myxococcales bacterium]|nr:LysR family transcriptional regulator [Myxococcales bacterium]
MIQTPFTFQQLQAFVTVAATLSYTRAAAALHVTQPAVSMMIQELERRLGVALFERSGRTFTLTAEGERFRIRTVEMLGMVEETLEELRLGTRSVSGVLRIGASTTLGNYILPQWLGRFYHQHPQTRVELFVENTHHVVEHLVAQEIAIAFIEGPCHDSRVVTRRFQKDELVLVCRPDHPWALRQTISLTELEAERVILREPGSGTRDVIVTELERAGVTIDTPLQLGHTEAIKTAVGAGLGVSILSRVACAREIEAKLLAEVRLDSVRMDRWFYCCRVKGKRDSPILRAFLDLAEPEILD